MEIDNRPSIEERCKSDLRRAYESGYRSGRLGTSEYCPCGSELEEAFNQGKIDGQTAREKANGGK
jgi:hypothetical protein